MNYYHVDVFTDKPFSGNGLTVFIGQDTMEKAWMQNVTIEMRQFESIFLTRINQNTFRAFIFTMEEELDFAGHPVIGAAAILHDLYSNQKDKASWTFQLNAKSVEVKTEKQGNFYSAQMNQGKPSFSNILTKQQEEQFLSYLNLSTTDTFADLPFEVISTGLPYLILPVKTNALSKLKVNITDLSNKLEEINAKFFYVLDVENLEGRTWDNMGLVEDIATGSAAGPVAAYLVKNNLAKTDTEIILNQGRFLGRPSIIKTIVKSSHTEIDEVLVEGDVCKIAVGELL
jgi:PhzF family phenazine biosynthesis protein